MSQHLAASAPGRHQKVSDLSLQAQAPRRLLVQAETKHSSVYSYLLDCQELQAAGKTRRQLEVWFSGSLYSWPR